MEQNPGPESESRPAKAPRSWLDLKWNNPENTSRLARTSRRLKCQRCSRLCKRNADCFLCKRWGQVSKFPKLSVKTVETGAAKPSEPKTADLEDARKYRQHWWRCNGPCRDKMPYLGVIRRSTSRRPGPTDKWWSEHVKTCGGTFVKVRNLEVPEPKDLNSSKNGDIRNFLSSGMCSGASDSSAVSSDVSGSTAEEADPLFQLDEEFENSLLGICDDIEVKVASDNKDSTVESDSCNKDSIVQIGTSFQSEEDDELNNSLLEVCDVVEARLQSEEDELVSCLACGVQIFKKQLDLHLITCMKDIFEVDLDEVGDGGANNGTSGFSCPFCLKSVSESVMKEHVDVCSSTEASASLFIDD